VAIPPTSNADFHKVLIKTGYEERVLLKAQQMDNPAWDCGDPLVIRGNPMWFDSYQARGAAPNYVGERTARFASNTETETPPRRRQIVGKVWDDHIPFDPNFDTWEQIKTQLVDEGNRLSAMAAFARQRDYQFFAAMEVDAVEYDGDTGLTQNVSFGETSVGGTADASLTVPYTHDGSGGPTGASVSKIIAMNSAMDSYNAQSDRKLLMHSIQYNQLFEEARATSTDFMMQATLPSGQIPSIMGHPLVVSNECTSIADIGNVGNDPGHYMYLTSSMRGVRTGEAGPIRVKLHVDEDRGDMVILSHYWVFEAVRAHEEDNARAVCGDLATLIA
jgi:hypothetical protein